MADIIRLIGAEHARICTLLDELNAELNGTGSDGQADRLSRTWRLLATLLESHLAAVEEICQLRLSAASPVAARAISQAHDDGVDLREALGEADLHRPGSRLWRLAAAAARDAALSYVRCIEAAMAEYVTRSSARERHALHNQWIAFGAARGPEPR